MSTVSTFISQRVKANRVLLVNAWSLVNTTAMTSVLGFMYWWVAARLFPPEAVGLASVAISSMMLLGTICTLGLGTLLIGELPRQPGREVALINAALILVLVVGACVGSAFALSAPLFSTQFQPLRANIGIVALFALGVGFTVITLVLDQALIGLLQGNLQFYRNTVFAIAKLAALFLLTFWTFQNLGLAIFATWVSGYVVSLGIFLGYALLKGRGLSRSYLPHWGLLRNLGPAALQHHAFNMVLQAPGFALPLLVAVMLSTKMNAWFYIADMLANFVFVIPGALTSVLYAMGSAQPNTLAHKLRLTMGLAFSVCLVAALVLFVGAKWILGLFGHTYADEAAWSLRILALGAFPMIIKSHYIALYRIRKAVARAIIPLTLCGIFELGASALGAYLGSLTGLSLGWLCALCIESLFMLRLVYRATRLKEAGGRDQRIKKPPSMGELGSFDTRQCTSCGAVMPAYANFCGVCGKRLDKRNRKLQTMKLDPTHGMSEDTETTTVVLSKTGTGRHESRIVQFFRSIGLVSLVLPLFALVLWSLSLNDVNVRQMNDLGLVSVLPATTIIALAVLVISFCIALRRPQLRVPILLLHVGLLIFMLYGITALVEDAPRFSTVYRHAGYTEYIMRTGSVNPDLDTYFSWPGFFILSAFVTKAAGYQSILSYAAWVPVFFNLLYLGPLYLILTSVTTNKHLVWASLWFFYLTNWIGQDYFSPQGLNFFFYLVIIAILLRWFKIAPQAHLRMYGYRWRRLGFLSLAVRKLYLWVLTPDRPSPPSRPRQRMAVLAILLAVFLLDVSSHPLTPFFVITSVATLVIFRRCGPFWLPLLMAVITGAWIIIMAQSFLVGHLSMVTGSIGAVSSSITSNVNDRVLGSANHIMITRIRLVMTVLLWGLAFIGGVRRHHAGYHDLTPILLALAPFPLFLTQDYGGEMLLRIYLFALPFMAFFAAALFYRKKTRVKSLWLTIAMAAMSLVLLGGFLFTRYGNERNDYVSKAMLDGVSYLYSIAPAGSVLIDGWDAGPWRFQEYEKYDYNTLSDDNLVNYVATRNVKGIIQFIRQEKRLNAYLVFMSSQKATFDSSSGFPPGSLDRLEQSLLTSGKFVLIYNNADIQILKFVGGAKGGAS